MAQTVQAALPALPLTQFLPNMPLAATNTLVGLSQTPGNLDYPAYVQYLTHNGHLRNPPTIQGVTTPVQPATSLLQHDRGDRDDRLMDYRPDQALWSQDNLPEILYNFDKPAHWLGKAGLKEPPLKTYPIYGNFLRDIPVLPDHISANVEGWRLEAWHRFDPRIRKYDLSDRMPPMARTDHNTDLSMRAQRFRKDANILGWVAKGGKFAAEKQRITGLLQGAGVPLNLNTTRGVSWGANPYGQRILVPANLRWDSCVEAAPAQAPVMPGVPAVVPVVSAVVNTQPPPATATGPVPAPAASFAASANTIPPSQTSIIPVTETTSAPRTLLPAQGIITSSSARSPSAPFTTFAGQQIPTINRTSSNPVPRHLDPRMFGPPRPFAQTLATGNMNPPQPSQAAPSMSLGPSTATSTNARSPQRPLNNSTSSSRQRSLSLAEALRAISATHDAAGPSSRNTIMSPAKATKRNCDNEEEDHDLDNIERSNQRPTKKPRPSIGYNEPLKKIRKRCPRVAFDGGDEGRPGNFAEWLQQGGSSDIANQAGLIEAPRIQPARPSIGYHGPLLYHHELFGPVVATSEDFLHPDGVDAGRFERINVGYRGQMPAMPTNDRNVAHYSHSNAVPATDPGQYTTQSQGTYLPKLEEGQSNLLPQELADSLYPPLD